MAKRNSKKSEINLNSKFKSPSIYRSITESIFQFVKAEKYVLIASLAGVFFFCLMLFAALQLSATYKRQQEVIQEKEQVVRDMSYWEGVVAEKPDYRDGYFMLAILQYRLGKKDEASKNVHKALEIDPNFTQGKEFEALLQK